MWRRINISARIRWKKLLNSLPFGRYQGYQKFAVVCHGRSGSTLLHTYLNYHPEIVSLGNVIGMFFENDLAKTGNTPKQFMEKKVFRAYSKKMKAVGLKVFYVYRNMEKNKEVLDYLAYDKSVKVIHLKRDNKLRVWASLQIALNEKVWIRSGKDEFTKIRVNPDECLTALREMDDEERHFDERFASHEMLTVYYHELVTHINDTLQEVQTFLGVKPQKLVSVLKKQHPQRLEELVENYDELKDVLAGTKWERFLADLEFA